MGQKIKKRWSWHKKQPNRGVEPQNSDYTWLKAATIRAVKTMAQTAGATIGTTAYIDEVNWKLVISSALLAGLLSILTSIGGLPEVKED